MTNNEALVIKKYPNRRLYNTRTSSYITLDELNELLRKDVDFKVVDAKSGEDITRVVLTQIILEQEQKGYELLPLDMLKQMIKLYNNPMSGMFAEFMLSALRMFNDGYSKTSEALNIFTSGANNPFVQHFSRLMEQNQEFLKGFGKK